MDGRWGQDGSAVTQQAGIAQEKLVVIFKTVNVLNRTRAVSCGCGAYQDIMTRGAFDV